MATPCRKALSKATLPARNPTAITDMCEYHRLSLLAEVGIVVASSTPEM